MVNPQVKREPVNGLMTGRDFGVTRACGLVRISSSLYRYRSRRPECAGFDAGQKVSRCCLTVTPTPFGSLRPMRMIRDTATTARIRADPFTRRQTLPGTGVDPDCAS